MSRIEKVIDEIEEYVEASKSYPLSASKIIINKEELIELLNELRDQVPDEVKKYQMIISNQDAIINDAQRKADAMLDDANKLTAQMVDQHEIMQKAYDNANQIIENANNQAQIIVDNATADAENIKRSVMKYSDDLLNEVQAIMDHIMDTSKGKFDSFISSLSQNYEIITQNRETLRKANSDEIQNEQ